MKDEDNQIDYDEGIVGHIERPRISFSNISEFNNDFRTARVSIKFKEDETKPQSDSVFNYWVGKGPRAKIKSLVINGYTMTWLANVRMANIQDVMKGYLPNIAVF